MNIALDFDGTYTADPELWDKFILLCQNSGHKVTIVTMRYPEEGINNLPYDVIYTNRKAKIKYCLKKGITFDIWIDNNPLISKWLNYE